MIVTQIPYENQPGTLTIRPTKQVSKALLQIFALDDDRRSCLTLTELIHYVLVEPGAHGSERLPSSHSALPAYLGKTPSRNGSKNGSRSGSKPGSVNNGSFASLPMEDEGKTISLDCCF